MKINKISRKLIKPHAPTPQNLKNYKLSFVDELAPPINFTVVLFYESKPKDCSLQLEESLARILVEFYPLAGRFMNNYSWIDCCDEGAELVEAEAPDVELIDLVATTEIDQLDNLLPDQHFRPHVDGGLDLPILSIQITRFSRGAAAIAISVAHEIFDGASLATFVDAWVDAANPDHDKRVIIRPSFHLPSLLPSVIRNVAPAPAPLPAYGHKFVSKRLFFNKESLRRLKSRIRQTNGKPLSGARVVTAVVAKAVIRLDRAVHGRSRTCVVFHPVNMRERSIPPQSANTCGNFWAPATTGPIEAADKLDFDQLVRLLRDSVRGAIARHAEILSPDRDWRDIYANAVESCQRAACDPEINVLTISDLSGFGFQKADFGWGKPVSSILRFGQPLGRFMLLMTDKSGDGIEASLSMYQHEVSYFEQDAEIKPFISYYPSRL